MSGSRELALAAQKAATSLLSCCLHGDYSQLNSNCRQQSEARGLLRTIIQKYALPPKLIDSPLFHQSCPEGYRVQSIVPSRCMKCFFLPIQPILPDPPPTHSPGQALSIPPLPSTHVQGQKTPTEAHIQQLKFPDPKHSVG